MKKVLTNVLLLFILFYPCLSLATSDFVDNVEAIEKASKSVLYIEVVDSYGNAQSSGSGFIAFEPNILITNYHVIEGAENFHVLDEALQEYQVNKILAVDKEKDIAILEMGKGTSLLPLTLASNPVLKRGQRIAAIGSPQGLINSFSEGTISSVYTLEGTQVIQFTAPISHGSSGGALFNQAGEVIGITSASFKDSQNINLAVAIHQVTALYEDRASFSPIKIVGTAVETQRIEEMGMTISVPANLHTVTRANLKEMAEVLKNYGMTPEQMGQMLEQKSMFVNILSDDNAFEIIGTMQPVEGVSMNEVSDAEIEQLAAGLKDQYAQANINFERSELFTGHPQTKFLKVYINQMMGEKEANSVQYYTVYNGKAMNVTFHSYDGPLTPEKEAFFKTIIDSIKFD